ncbi:MAG: hypothetical protein RLY72_671, partial [Planctomycetota bacterium]
AAELNAITARIVTNSVVTVNALNMSATQLDAVSANAAYINSISNLTVTASNSAADITTLFSKTANGSVLVNALTMSADQKGSVAAGIVKVSAISNLTLASSEDATEMGQLFSKTADLAVAVNALAMSGDQKDAMSSSFGKISVITALTFASSEDASQITTFASKTTGAVAVATGMSSEQLSALGAVATKIAVDGITGTLAIDVAVTSLDALLGKTAIAAIVNVDATTFDAAGKGTLSSNISKVDAISNLALASSEDATEIGNLLPVSTATTAVATGMASDQLSALGAGASFIAADGITGTLAIDVAVTNLNDLLGKTAVAATVNVNANSFGTAGKSTLSSNISKVDAISSLSLVSTDVTGVIANLLTKASAAVADGSSMSSAQLSALGFGASSIAADGITGTLAIDNAVTSLDGLLGKTAIAAIVNVNATGFDAAGKGTLSSNISKVDAISNLALASSEDATEIGNLLTKASAAVANATGMGSAQLNALSSGFASIAASGITGTFTVDSSITSVSNLLSRVSTAADVTVNLAGMSAGNVAAVNSNLSLIDTMTGAPVSIVRAGSIVGYQLTIQAGIDYAAAGDVVNVLAGTYAELLYVNKALTLRGPNAAKAGTDATRGAEAIIQFPSSAANGSTLVSGSADGITLEGLDLRLQDSRVTGGSYGYIYDSPSLNNLAFRNNRMYSGEIAIYIDRNTANDTPKSGLVIAGNFIDCGPFVNSSFNRAMYITNTAGTIEGNTIVNANYGIQYMPYANPGAGTIRGNAVSAALTGLYHNYQGQGAASVSWEDNTVTVAANDRSGLRALVDSGRTTTVDFRGIQIITFGNADYGAGAAPSVSFTGNAVDASIGATGYNTAAREAVRFSAPYVSGSATFSGNSFTNWTVGVNAGFSASFEMSCNWWGNTDASTLATAIPGTLRFSPFRASSTDTSCTGVGAVVLVGKGRSYSSITAALAASATAAGDSLTVAGGNFSAETLSVADNNLSIALDAAAILPSAGFTLATDIASLTLSGAGDANVAGNAVANTVVGSSGINALTGLEGNDNLTSNAGADAVDGGTGIDTANFAISYVGAITGSTTLSVDGDTVNNVELLAFTDATVAIVGRGGSEYDVLNDALSASSSTKLWGNLAFSSTTVGFTDTDSLNAILARVVSGSTLTVNVIGMNTAQLAAVAANSASFPTLAYPPVQVVSSGNPSGYFTTIQAGITFATAGDTINVSAGTYVEALTVAKTLTLNGPNAGKSGTDVTRGAEAIIYPPAGFAPTGGGTTIDLVAITAADVILDGLKLDGDNTSNSSPYTANGANMDVDTGVFSTGNGTVVRNCVIVNAFQFGVALGGNSAYLSLYGEVLNNRIDNIPYFSGILVFDGYYAKIDGNTINNAWRGIQTNNHAMPAPIGAVAQISNNTVTTKTQAIVGGSAYMANETDVGGILNNLQYGTATGWTISGNTVTNTGGATSDSVGMQVWSIQ